VFVEVTGFTHERLILRSGTKRVDNVW